MATIPRFSGAPPPPPWDGVGEAELLLGWACWALLFLDFESGADGLRLGFAYLVVQATMSNTLRTCATAWPSSLYSSEKYTVVFFVNILEKDLIHIFQLSLIIITISTDLEIK
jgi:hypothetical protein